MMDIGGHLRCLLRFNGRERRTTFWLWVLICYGVQTVVGMAGGMAVIWPLFRQADLSADTPSPTGAPLSADVSMSMGWFFAVIVASIVLAVGLLAAAIVRRLHDTGRSGWWAAPAAACQVATLTLFWRMFSAMFVPENSLANGPPPEFFLAFVSNLLGMMAIVALIVCCCLPTQETSNRYGPPPGAGVG